MFDTKPSVISEMAQEGFPIYNRCLKDKKIVGKPISVRSMKANTKLRVFRHNVFVCKWYLLYTVMCVDS
jgi:hypothetical protein